MSQYSLDGSSPQLIGDDVWLAPTAQVIGNVVLGQDANI
jgi:carbonic anhydrase/acetyltransferase-like protein (isoleucine patch superfamily)